MKVKQTIVIEKRDDEEWVYLKEMYDAETFVAGKLIRLDNVKNRKQISKIKEKLEKQEKSSNIELSEKQKEAIYAVSEHNVSVITGGPRNRKNNDNQKHNRALQKRRKKSCTMCTHTAGQQKE